MRAALAVFLLASSLAAQEDPIEARLRKLEQEVADLRKENEQLRRDLGLEVVARQSAAKMNGRAENLSIGGLIQAQRESGDRGDSRFSDSNARAYLRRARVNFQGRFLEDFTFRTEVEFAGSLTNATGFRAQLTDAYLNWNRFDLANVRVGQFKTPFGFEQLYLDPRLYTIERSLVSDRLTPGRQIGVQLAGVTGNERFGYWGGLFNGSGTNQNFNDNDRFMASGRISFVPLTGRFLDESARWSIGMGGFRSTDTSLSVASDFGISSRTGTRDNLFTGRRRGIAWDTQVEVGPFEFWGEYLRTTFEPTSAIPSRLFRAHGWYGQASYFLIRDRLQIVSRLENFRHIAGVDTRSTVSGVNWYIKQHDLKLQLDWMRSRVAGLPEEQDKILARIQAAF